MKHLYNIFTLLIIATFAWSCNDDSNFGIPAVDETTATKSFAEPDDATDISARTSGYKLYKLLQLAGPEVGESLGYQNITDEQYAEIKAFTDNLVAGCTTDEEIHSTVFSWIYGNLKYEWSDNDPYPVFKNKKGICQGYANLLKVMLHTQGIPCVLVNGNIPEGGHAWNAVYYNNKWTVSDPTNNYFFSAAAYSKNSRYSPTSIDAILFEDEYCTYNYIEEALNVHSIKEGAEVVSIPYSAGGIVVASLNPSIQVPDNVKEIYVGTNIRTFGQNIVGLKTYSKSVEQIHVDPESKYLESFSTGIYDKSSNNLILIAPAAKHLELKPIETFDKESVIKNLPSLETITFVPGTISIGPWTVEGCPNLHTVFAPSNTSINSAAFSGTAAGFKIIRGNFTNVPQITY